MDLSLYIDGEWLNGAGRSGEAVYNPATGAAIGHLPHATSADLDYALDAASRGFEIWRGVSAFDRARVMRKAADLVRERIESIARVITQEQGKVYSEAVAEVMYTADIIEWYAEEGRRAYGRIVPGRTKGTRQLVVQEPVGVTVAFTPWNFPAQTPARKIGGALAAGCSIILKASEETPGSCIELVRCFADAGLPEGVLNLVFGVAADISQHLLSANIVRKVSFTGSVPVGKHLAMLAARGMKRTTMELGGHAPVVVFDDANPEAAADVIAAFKYRNAGQVCVSPTRFYVQENSFKRFCARFVQYARSLRLGNGLDGNVTMGPLANPRRIDAMDAFVKDSIDRGGKLVTGGKRHGNKGWFFEPTVISDLPDDADLMTREPFGPIAPIVSFKSFDEVVERANSLEYGLAAYAFTESGKTAAAIGDALASGMVGINSTAISTPETPFGGIKESGYGSEGGVEGLQSYLNTKLIAQA